jgi:hypothetical protein
MSTVVNLSREEKCFHTKFNDPALNMVSALYLFTVYVSSTSFNVQPTTVTTERPPYYGVLPTIHSLYHHSPATFCHHHPFWQQHGTLNNATARDYLGWWPRQLVTSPSVMFSFLFYLLLFYLLPFLFKLLYVQWNDTKQTVTNGIHDFDGHVTKRPTVRVSFFFSLNLLLLFVRYVQWATRSPMANVYNVDCYVTRRTVRDFFFSFLKFHSYCYY